MTGGGAGTVRLSRRGLAALVTAHLDAASLRTLGILEAPDDELAKIDQVFAGPAPWMREMF